MKMKVRIETEFVNRFVCNAVFFVLEIASVLIVLQFFTEFFYYPMLIEPYAVVIMMAVIVIAPVFIWLVLRMFLKIRLKLSNLDGKLTLISRGVFAKAVINSPINFEGKFVEVKRFSGRLQTFFRLTIIRKNKKPLEYFERIQNDDKPNKNIEVIKIKKPKRMMICDTKYPGKLWKVFQILEKLEKPSFEER